MQQVQDFIEECEVLSTVFKVEKNIDFNQETQFKKWSVNDVLVHLYFWNMAADQSLNAPDEFTALYAKLREGLEAGNLRTFENDYIKIRGLELLEAWQNHYKDMGQRWSGVDPKLRVKWAGPDMSTRSSISARQMETWAHGQAIFDVFGLERPESDRIRNIVFLGVNAFGWSHMVNQLEVPEKMPRLELLAPSGEVWAFGEKEAGSVFGIAVEFCQVVTQTRNLLDTELKVEGEVAEIWMKNAQCFAGPPETPPSAGSRFKVEKP